jgi:hypothetical protein
MHGINQRFNDSVTKITIEMKTMKEMKKMKKIKEMKRMDSLRIIGNQTLT